MIRETNRLRDQVLGSRFGALAALAPRGLTGARHVRGQIGSVGRWLINSREHTNFTYELTRNNIEQLIWFVSAITEEPYETIANYVGELRGDTKLRSAYSEAIRNSRRRSLADTDPRFGRRLAWYAIARALKPGLIVETGTDKGLGSLVLASALIRNGSGRLVTIDINPAAGYLIRGEYADVTTIWRGDSILRIGELDQGVDLFLHDSDHSASHERLEFDAILPHLNPGAILMSDNAHVTSVLSDWAQEHQKRFLFFAEEPANHWYRGAGLGVAW